MVQLNFKGKPFVQNFHLTVPHHELIPNKKASLTEKISLHDNLVIHGDNLKALKALLPTYAGKVKCIYIDPPYNTGNEGWVYNDNVTSPMMQEWLGKVVDKEDLTRHDKWLCMMMPRLRLLRELLRDDGVIFISIDDNEVTHLRLLMDEIFGELNFVSHIVVQLNPRGRTLDRYLAKTHEYILVYAKDINQAGLVSIPKTEEALAEYKYSEGNLRYRLLELRNRNPVFNRSNRPNLYYPFYVNSKDGSISIEKKKGFDIEVYPLNSKEEEGCWTWGQKKAASSLHMLVAKQVNTGAWRVFRKDYVPDEGALTKAKCLWIENDINNENGKEILRQVFGGDSPFDFPKSIELVKKCVQLSTSSDEEDIVLDSYAGSGTTAHAVLSLNNEDSGNRRFIAIECENYADSVTAERIRRVIKGIPTARNHDLQKGLGGGFSYFDQGNALAEENLLEGKKLPSYEELARYLFFTATGEQWEESRLNHKSNFIGESSNHLVYLFYKPDLEYLKSTAFTLDRVEALGEYKGKRRLVFAPTKYLDQEYLDRFRIDFCQLPFQIYKRME
ncbi:MAG: site-specific DNA-methyltransferase [Alphaproteobacteria bacterium]|nr:MAG: site-specific DNA-methyltransferase [Alphaproteobacteria bacterium]